MFKALRFSILFSMFAQLSLASTPQFLDHAIGVYLSPGGLENFTKDMPKILETNGFYLNNITHEGTEVILTDKKLEDYFSEKADQDKVIGIKNFLTTFFDFKVDSKTYSIQLQDLTVQPKWKQIGLHILPPPTTIPSDQSKFSTEDTITAKGYIQLESETIKIDVANLIATDVENPHLGKIEISGISVKNKGAKNLWLNIPFILGKKPNGQFFITVLTPSSSFDQIELQHSYKNLKLPQVDLIINGKKKSMSIPQIREFLASQSETINQKIKEKAKDFAYDQLPKIINEKLNDITTNGLSEINRMRPPGAPENQLVTSFEWKLELTDIDFQGPFFHIGLGAYFEDPLFKNTPLLRSEYHSKSLPSPQTLFLNSDINFSLSQSVLNRVIQLSYQRGYFREILTEEDKIVFVKPPVINFSARTDEYGIYHNPSTITLMIAYDVEGFSSIAVKNPMRIQFDLKLGTYVQNNQIKLVAKGIDSSSIHVPEKDVYVFYESVLSKVKRKLKDKAKGFNNYEIIDNLPIPTSFGGAPLSHTGSKILESGHIIVSSELIADEVNNETR